MIEATGLKHRYQNRTVLDLPQLRVGKGETCLILGASGSGKTTLLHVLAGILKPTQGEVRIEGTSITAINGSALDRFRGRQIGIVLQRLHLVGAISVLQNLLLAQSLAGREPDQNAAIEVLKNLDVAGRSHAYPRELSHGQAQRVAIARAVINRPSVILADEPTSNLDDANCREALNLLRGQARACNAALVIATHDARIKDQIEQRIELNGAKNG
jgi:putative ABC transport system ATP-binding protein